MLRLFELIFGSVFSESAWYIPNTGFNLQFPPIFWKENLFTWRCIHGHCRLVCWHHKINSNDSKKNIEWICFDLCFESTWEEKQPTFGARPQQVGNVTFKTETAVWLHLTVDEKKRMLYYNQFNVFKFLHYIPSGFSEQKFLFLGPLKHTFAAAYWSNEVWKKWPSKKLREEQTALKIQLSV